MTQRTKNFEPRNTSNSSAHYHFGYGGSRPPAVPLPASLPSKLWEEWHRSQFPKPVRSPNGKTDSVRDDEVGQILWIGLDGFG